MPPNLSADHEHGTRIERHRNRFSRLCLIGMNPGKPPHQVHLGPLQTRDIAPPQPRGQGKRRQIRQVLRQLGKEPLRLGVVVSKDAAHPDAILVRSHDMNAMKVPDSVRAIGRAGAGTSARPASATPTT